MMSSSVKTNEEIRNVSGPRPSRKGYVWRRREMSGDSFREQNKKRSSSAMKESLTSPNDWERIWLELVIIDGISYVYGWDDDENMLFAGRVGGDAFGLKQQINALPWEVVVWSINARDLHTAANEQYSLHRRAKSWGGHHLHLEESQAPPAVRPRAHTMHPTSLGAGLLTATTTTSTTTRRLTSTKYYSADDVFSKLQNKIFLPSSDKSARLAPLGTYQFQIETGATGLLQLAARTRYELGIWIDALRLAAQATPYDVAIPLHSHKKPDSFSSIGGYWSIWSILGSDFARTQLKKFLSEQVATEGIEFWEAVERLRRVIASGSGARRGLANQIYNEFVIDDAPRQVTLSAQIKTKTKRDLDAFIQTRGPNAYNQGDTTTHEDSLQRQQRKVRYLLGDSEALVAQKETKIARLLGGREAALALNAGQILVGRLSRANSAPSVLNPERQLPTDSMTKTKPISVFKQKSTMDLGSTSCCDSSGQSFILPDSPCLTCFDAAVKQVVLALEQDALFRFAATAAGRFVDRVLRAEHSNGALKVGALRIMTNKGSTKFVACLLAPRSLVWWSKPGSSPKSDESSKNNKHSGRLPPSNELLLSSVLGVDKIAEPSQAGHLIALRLDDTSGARILFATTSSEERDVWADLIHQAVLANQQTQLYDDIFPSRDWQLDRLDDSPKKQDDPTWSDIETVESDDDDDDEDDNDSTRESASYHPIIDSSTAFKSSNKALPNVRPTAETILLETTSDATIIEAVAEAWCSQSPSDPREVFTTEMS